MRFSPGKSLFLLSITLIVVFSSAFAEADIDTENQEEVVAEVQAEDSIVLQPKAVEGSFYQRRSSDTSMVLAVYLFLFMVAVVIGFWVYSRKGGLKMNRLTPSKDLKIRETKPLGNKQFLVVVEYGEQKMLLGVAPGMINHLCYLDSPDIPCDREISIEEN